MALCALLAGCSDHEVGALSPAGTCGSPVERAPILWGSSNSKLFGLLGAQRRAVVEVSVGDVQTEAGACSAVVVARHAMLTAAHCLGGALSTPEWISVGIRDTAGTQGSTFIVSVDEVFLHPYLDVAIMVSGALERLDSDIVMPLTPHTAALGREWVGTPVEIAGFGVTETRSPDGPRFVTEEVSRVEDDHLVVDGKGWSGACVGDSGGPALGRDDTGAVRVLGILDDGDRSCVGEDFFIRLDRLNNWAPYAELVAPHEASGAPCDGLVAAGECFRGRAMWCDGSSAHVDDCKAGGKQCGWDSDSAGFRCVAAESDPCSGLGSFARCEEGQVISCSRGRLRSVDCLACGTSCVPWQTRSGAGCLP